MKSIRLLRVVIPEEVAFQSTTLKSYQSFPEKGFDAAFSNIGAYKNSVFSFFYFYD
jgi:hypothetical protein